MEVLHIDKMVKSICLKDMFERECSDLVITRENTRVLLDTNFFRYGRVNMNGFRLALTSGVIGELWKYQDIFPAEAVRELMNLSNPYIFEHMIRQEDELQIKSAVIKYARKLTENGKKLGEGKAFRKNGLIGWVDMQQIGYAMERARRGEKTLMVSNDGDILGTIDVLRGDLEHVKKNVAAVSVRNYLERQYTDFLEGHEGNFRKALIREIEELHGRAA